MEVKLHNILILQVNDELHAPVTIELEAWWVPEPYGYAEKREISHWPRIDPRFLRPARSLVAIPIELSRRLI
jgi:hypothetical protein